MYVCVCARTFANVCVRVRARMREKRIQEKPQATATVLAF